MKDIIFSYGLLLATAEQVAGASDVCKAPDPDSAPKQLAPIRVFSDFDDTIYSSMRQQYYSFASGSDQRKGWNATHGRIYAGVGWLFHALSYAHGGPASSIWQLVEAAKAGGAKCSDNLQELGKRAEEELERLLVGGGVDGSKGGRMDVVLATARPAQEGTADPHDPAYMCGISDKRRFGSNHHPGDRIVMEYMQDVGQSAHRDEGWGFAQTHGYAYLSVFAYGLVRNIIGGLMNFFTTLDIASPVNGTPVSISDRRGTYAKVGALKAEFILSWVWVKTNEQFVFFGDNGQGDVCTAALLLKNFSNATDEQKRRFKGVFVHDIGNHTNHGDDPIWAGHRGELGITPRGLDEFECGLNTSEFQALMGSSVFFFGNFLDAINIMESLDLLSPAAIERARAGFFFDRSRGLCCDGDPGEVDPPGNASLDDTK